LIVVSVKYISSASHLWCDVVTETKPALRFPTRLQSEQQQDLSYLMWQILHIMTLSASQCH